MKGHQELQKNKQIAQEEDITKSYVPLRGGASRTHMMNMDLADQQSQISAAASTQSAGSVYSLSE